MTAASTSAKWLVPGVGAPVDFVSLGSEVSQVLCLLHVFRRQYALGVSALVAVFCWSLVFF